MFDLRHTLELIDDGALDEAVTALEDALARMPAYTPAYVLLAETYETQGRWSDALTTWQQARFFAPNSPTIEAGLLRALEHQDIAAEAETPDTELEEDVIDTPQRSDGPHAATEDDATPATDAAAPPSSESSAPQPPRDPATPVPEHPDAETAQADLGAPSRPHPPEDESDSGDDEGRILSEEDAPPQDAPSSETPSEEEDAHENDEPPSTSSGAPPKPSAQPRPSPLDELASRLPNPDQPLPDDLQDLDRLIDELESARIDPQPDVENAPAPNLDNDVDDMVSETLARIYIAQKQYAEAARVYVRLAHQDPDRAEEYHEKAAELRRQARDADQ
jgi:tetratricopeptide (TPR) repeat protein